MLFWTPKAKSFFFSHAHPHPLFEGAFSIGSEIFHVKTKESFNLAKRSFDPHDPSDSPLVIYRDSDMLDMHSNDQHLMTRNSNSPAECAADETAFNQKKLTGRRIVNNFKERSLSDLYDPALQFWSSPKKYSALTKRSDIYQGCPKSRLSKTSFSFNIAGICISSNLHTCFCLC